MTLTYTLFSAVGCDKCKEAKEYLKEMNMDGVELDVHKDILAFRKTYPSIRDKVQKYDSGALKIPVIVLYDSMEDVMLVASSKIELKEIIDKQR